MTLSDDLFVKNRGVAASPVAVEVTMTGTASNNSANWYKEMEKARQEYVNNLLEIGNDDGNNCELNAESRNLT